MNSRQRCVSAFQCVTCSLAAMEWLTVASNSKLSEPDPGIAVQIRNSKSRPLHIQIVLSYPRTLLIFSHSVFHIDAMLRFPDSPVRRCSDRRTSNTTDLHVCATCQTWQRPPKISILRPLLRRLPIPENHLLARSASWYIPGRSPRFQRGPHTVHLPSSCRLQTHAAIGLPGSVSERA
jgi:hypothetical protein